jgi:PAS domain S-box-containing protein
MADSWKDWIGVGSRTRLSLAASGGAYVLLAAISIAFFVQLQGGETRMRDFLVRDDRTMFSRTSLEYERAIQALQNAVNSQLPLDVQSVRGPIDILHNRLTVFNARSDATQFVNGLPEFERFVRTLDGALAEADRILDLQGETLSRDAAGRTLAALDTVRPLLEAAVGKVIANSAAQRDALQRDLDQLQTLTVTSMIGFAAGSLLFVGYFARGNRQIARQNRELVAGAEQLRRSEARLHAFMHNAPAVMAILDPDGRFEMVNARAERFYGRPEAEIVGRRGVEIRTLSGEPELEALKRSVVEAGEAQHAQLRHVTPFGEVWKLNVAFPIHDAVGGTDAIGVIGLDITELKNVEDEMNRQRERAEQASEAKSRMLANASHELRTPLNAIIGFSEVISGEMFGPVGMPNYKEYAADIVRSGKHLVGIVDTMLDLSRIETGQAELALVCVHPDELVASALLLVQPAAAAGGHTIEVRRDQALSDLLVDRGKMTQVLVNLLSNAVKFTRPGGRIAVGCLREPEGLIFVVEDNGIGIAAKDLPQVVLPFTRGGSARVRTQEGTGLGLAIAKALVEEHDGALVLESTPGVGTRVTVRLPATRIAPPVPRIRTA